MVLGKEGQEDFKNRFPERAAKAIENAVLYTKGLGAFVWVSVTMAEMILKCINGNAVVSS